MLRWLVTLLRVLLGLFAQGKGPRGRLPPAKPPSRERAPRAPSGAGRRDDGRVRVEYSPHPDGAPDPGEIVWTWVPFEDDPSQGKDRPVLLVGRRARSLVGVALTSKQHARVAQVELGEGPWDRERRTSYAKVDRLLDVDASKVRREGAVLPRERFDRVVMALRAVHGDAVA